MNKKEHFKEKLNYYMNKKGVTPGVLSASLGCLSSLVELWAKGERMPEDEMIEKIATFFSVPKEEFILEKSSKNESEKKKTLQKRLVLGNCVRCGKPIYQGDKFGKGEARKFIRSEMFKDPIEDTEYIYEEGGDGYDYFCESCAEYLTLQKRLEEQKEKRDRLSYLTKVNKRAVAIGIHAFIIALIAALIFAVNIFNFFPWNLLGTYKILSVLGSFVFGYYVFSLMHIVLSGKTWLSNILSWSVNHLYGYLVGNAATSKNEVLMNGVVRLIIILVAATFSTIIFTPILIVVGLFSLFMWPFSKKEVKEEIKSLREELYK